MEDQPLSLEEAEKKAKSKAAHRASMIGTGFWMLGCGLVAAYLAFGKAGDLPAFMYGHLRGGFPESGWTGAAIANPGDVLGAYARKDPAQAKSVLRFIERRMTDGMDAGYVTFLTTQSPGASERRLFAAANGAIISAVFDYRDVLEGKGQDYALKTLDLWWTKGVRNGVVRHELSAAEPAGLPEDQLAMANAFVAAFDATHASGHRERARALLAKLPASGGNRAELEKRLKAPAAR